jgi:hypothetical protein
MKKFPPDPCAAVFCRDAAKLKNAYVLLNNSRYVSGCELVEVS